MLIPVFHLWELCEDNYKTFLALYIYVQEEIHLHGKFSVRLYGHWAQIDWWLNFVILN